MIGFKYKNVNYYYARNGQNDIIALYNQNGVKCAEYVYDTWGNVIKVLNGGGYPTTDPLHVGNANPFRYRGYYYDTESKLYYLNSRYYDPDTHRFINWM